MASRLIIVYTSEAGVEVALNATEYWLINESMIIERKTLLNSLNIIFSNHIHIPVSGICHLSNMSEADISLLNSFSHILVDGTTEKPGSLRVCIQRHK